MFYNEKIYIIKTYIDLVINMLKIVFDSFNKMPGHITLNIKTYENNNLVKDDEIYFKMDVPLIISDSQLAIALSTFCRRGYDEIYFDLSLTPDLINKLTIFTNAKISTKQILEHEHNNSIYHHQKHCGKIALNFSGGFDSLAAKILLGNYVELISISFFDIEYNFFKKFKPHILETNFRQLGYAENDWTFMGVGSILFKEFLNHDYHVFGTVFEAFHMHATQEFSSKKKFIEEPFNFAGITDLKIIQGLTEIGTALVLCNTYPHLVNDSLTSLSQPKTEKRYRKQIIINILQKKFNINDIYLEPTEPPTDENKLIWGNYFAVDFLALYMIKYAGIEETSKILRDIPEEAIDFAKNHTLTFYERFNPNFYNNIPDEFKTVISINLAKSKVLSYDQNDFNELHEVNVFLSKYYAFLKNII